MDVYTHIHTHTTQVFMCVNTYTNKLESVKMEIKLDNIRVQHTQVGFRHNRHPDNPSWEVLLWHTWHSWNLPWDTELLCFWFVFVFYHNTEEGRVGHRSLYSHLFSSFNLFTLIMVSKTVSNIFSAKNSVFWNFPPPSPPPSPLKDSVQKREKKFILSSHHWDRQKPFIYFCIWQAW